jgi:hypothetical protein
MPSEECGEFAKLAHQREYETAGIVVVFPLSRLSELTNQFPQQGEVIAAFCRSDRPFLRLFVTVCSVVQAAPRTNVSGGHADLTATPRPRVQGRY